MSTTWHFGPHIHYHIMIRLEWLACLLSRAFMTSLCWERPVLSARHFEILSFLKALRNHKWFYIRCRIRTKKTSFLHIFFLILSSTWAILPSVRLCLEVDFHQGGCGAHLIGWCTGLTALGCMVRRRGAFLAIIYAPKIFLRLIFVLCVLLFCLCVCAVPMEARWRCRVLWNWTHSCEPLCRCWGPNPVNKYSSLMSHIARSFQNILKSVFHISFYSDHDCKKILSTFKRAFVSKNPCNITGEDYEPLIKLVTQTIPCNKVTSYSFHIWE